MPESDTWDPDQYGRFARQRERPFLDLIDLLDVGSLTGGRVLDLGCGTGALTRVLHERTGASLTVGVDSSAAMIGRAPEVGGMRFVVGDLLEVEDDVGFDVVVANASLQWVAEHEAAVVHAWSLVRPGGQFAFQVPSNFHRPAHTVADAVGRRHGLAPLARSERVLTPGGYADLLHRLGADDQLVRLQVYGHAMASTAEVLEWVRGSLLTHYERELGDRFAAFLNEYRAELLAALGDPDGTAPYFDPFERILVWARRPSGQLQATAGS